MDWIWIYRCWPLSATCSIDWEAWSALGSLGAVAAALWIAGRQSRQQRSADRRREAFLMTEIRHPVLRWLNRARQAQERLALGLDVSLYTLLTGEDTIESPTEIPNEILELRGSLHELGDAGVFLADAIGLARVLDLSLLTVCVRGDIDDDGSIRADFRENLEQLVTALGILKERSTLVPSKRGSFDRWWKWLRTLRRRRM